MLNRLARILCIAAALQVCGGHWMALQTAAWAGMLANYARGETLVAAIEKTFDGEHPCSLCKVVDGGRTEEQKQQVLKIIVKLEAVLEAAMPMPMPQGAEWKYFASVPEMAARTLAPPTPPPQAG